MTNKIENSYIKQLRRDLSRATFYVKQMEYADSKFRKYYYGIQAIVFGAIIQVRYEKEIRNLIQKNLLK